jgi:hypothetical protein
MKTFFTIVITSAIVSGSILATDFGRDVLKARKARAEFVKECDDFSSKDSGVRVHATGLLDETITFELPGASVTEEQFLQDETLHGEQAEDKNFRDAFRQMGFAEIRVGQLPRVKLPAAELVGPAANGNTEYDFPGNC